MYPFAEVFEVDTNGTTAVDVWDIPAGTIIAMVLAEIQVSSTGTGANIIVGDDDDDDGFILAASCCTTAGTIYGDAPEERGAYLYTGVSYHSGKWKYYDAAGKELKIDSSAANTTEATLRIYVFGYRYTV